MIKHVKQIFCDILILGSGAAGLRAAISAREKGLDVIVISKGTPGKGTCTFLSGGVFAGTREGVSTDRHLARTLQAGRGINQQELAALLVEEGPMRLKELMEWGMKAEFYRGYLFAKGRPPVWGEEIIRCLLSKNRALGTRFMEGLLATDLQIQDGKTQAMVHSGAPGEWILFSAKALILATGGAGALYLRHNNPPRMLGEGYALALGAGATLQDMEFVQFSPLGLAEPKMPPFLIPPRPADLGRLYNNSGDDIPDKYGIEERPAAERARDRLSLALFKEIHREKEEVWLDLRGVPEEEWFGDPFSASTFERLGKRYGALYRPLRVAPMTHHCMGGVMIDTQGATSVPGLFAAGEVTGGLHGANRLGGNALTETLVFGARAGEAAAAWAKDSTRSHRQTLHTDIDSWILKNKPRKSSAKSAKLMGELRKILWEEGGILRDRHGLNRALDRVKSMQDEALEMSYGADARALQRTWELRLCFQTATFILEGALKREESRGAHFREDFPHQDDERWRGHLQVRLSAPGERVWTFRSN